MWSFAWQSSTFLFHHNISDFQLITPLQEIKILPAFCEAMAFHAYATPEHSEF
jgi:hypothetical protein